MIADLGARRRIRDLGFELIQIHETFAERGLRLLRVARREFVVWWDVLPSGITGPNGTWSEPEQLGWWRNLG